VGHETQLQKELYDGPYEGVNGERPKEIRRNIEYRDDLYVPSPRNDIEKMKYASVLETVSQVNPGSHHVNEQFPIMLHPVLL
jgi:hypothetical protein